MGVIESVIRQLENVENNECALVCDYCESAYGCGNLTLQYSRHVCLSCPDQDNAKAVTILEQIG